MTDVIHTYSREEAIGDGVLIDVTSTAQEAGFRYPVALTSAVWAECVSVPDSAAFQDEMGRLWDLLTILREAIRRSRHSSVIQFVVLVQNDELPPQPKTLKSVCGPGDDGAPVITVMLPDED